LVASKKNEIVRETILEHLHFLDTGLEVDRRESIEPDCNDCFQAVDSLATLSELELGIFRKIKVRQFENGGTHVWLWAGDVSMDKFCDLVKKLVDIYGPDCNDKTYLLEPEKEVSIIENYHSRYWEFDLNHQCFDEEKQQEKDFFYIISLTRDEKKVELTLMGLENLLYKLNKKITWL
jgi:hypothetical protein